MLTSFHLHMKRSEVCISPPASLPMKGQVTKQTTVKRPIDACAGISVGSWSTLKDGMSDDQGHKKERHCKTVITVNCRALVFKNM